MHTRSHHDFLLVGLALLLTAVAAVGKFSLPLDVDNESMKSTATPTARAAAQRAREFGREFTILALLEPEPGRPSAALEDSAVTAWRAEIDSLPDVRRTRVLPASGTDGSVLAVEGDGGGDAVERTCDRIRAATPPGHRVSLTGQLVGELAIARALDREQHRVVPAIVATLTLVLFLIYRRPSLVLAALLPGIGAILWLGGLQFLAGLSINPVSALLAPVVLIVGVAGAVHVVERHLDLLRAGTSPREAPGRAVRSLARPILLTAATTAAGFLVLTLRSIPAVRTFGILAAVGVLLVLVWTVILVPCWLRLFGPRAAPARRRTPGRSGRYVGRLRHAAPWLVGAVVVASLFLAGRGLDVAVDTDPVRILPESHPFRVETERIAARSGGIETFEVLLPSPPAARAAQRVATLAAELAKEPQVQSLLGAPRRSAEGSLLLGALLGPGGTAERAALFARAEERAVRAGFVGARATGPAVLVARDSETLVREQRRGLLAMLGLLWVLMSLGFRSWRLGLLGLLPNAIPCAALYGGLALAGRPLSVATTMIATVLLGLIVDDTIHFLHDYRVGRRDGERRIGAIVRSLDRCGRPIVITSLVLALGFGAGLVGELATTTEFSALSALTILAALVCDLLVLPAVLILLPRRGAVRFIPPPTEATSCAETTT